MLIFRVLEETPASTVRLLTLGAWELRNATRSLTRYKPLLLLAYLVLEGPQLRTHLRELLWRSARDPSASLRVAIHQLRTVAPQVLLEEGSYLRAVVSSDLGDLLSAARAGEHHRVLSLHQGRFADTVDRHDEQEDITDWIQGTRRTLAQRVITAALEVETRRSLTATEQAALETTSPESCDPVHLQSLAGLLERLNSPLLARLE
ncbi:MAG: hypothetical protein HC933_03910 [Pleurocapsa sp. SU_196_0]|nr:hypothetical protein [Pleurocapsa sp. SU_196_0]